MKPVKLIGSNHWFIKVLTKEFGEVLLLEDGEILPRTFDSEESALEYIQEQGEDVNENI